MGDDAVVVVTAVVAAAVVVMGNGSEEQTGSQFRLVPKQRQEVQCDGITVLISS